MNQILQRLASVFLYTLPLKASIPFGNYLFYKYSHIAIGVKDIHLICQALENNGCKITTKPKTTKNSTTVLAFVEDPDGYKVELIERD